MSKRVWVVLLAVLLMVSFALPEVTETLKDKDGSPAQMPTRVSITSRVEAYQASRTRSTLDEGFESGAIPVDWTIYDFDGDGYQWEAYYTSSAHSGNYVARVHYNTTGCNDWLITPPLAPQSGDSLIFWARSYSSSWPEDMIVKLSTTGVDSADFTVTLGSYTNLSTTWEKYAYDLSPYAGSVVYVAVICPSVDAFYLYVDDFSGPEIYVPPTPVFTTPYTSVSLNEAYMGIPTVGESVTGKIYISNTGGGDLNISQINTGNPDITVSPSTLTIPAGATDSVWVTWTPSAAGMDTSWVEFISDAASSPDTVGVTLQTAPADYWTLNMELPYSDWWSPTGYNLTLIGLWGYTTYNPHWGYQGMWKSGYNGKDTTYVWTPRLDLSSLSGSAEMGFWYKGTSSGDDTVEVLVSTDNLQTWTVIGKVVNHGSTWRYQSFDLSAYVGNDNVRIGWHYYYPVGNTSGSSFYMDDIVLPPRWYYPGGLVYSSISSYDFGTVSLGDTATVDVVLTNAGGSVLNITSITSDNPEFQVWDVPTSIASTASDTFIIAYVPTTYGNVSANITVDHDGTNGSEDLLVIPVSGFGYTIQTFTPPWYEPFATTTFDPMYWDPVSFMGNPQIIDINGVATGTFPYPLPSDPYMMEISGESSGHDEAVTALIDMTGLSDMQFSFWKSEQDLEIGEYVLVQYKASDGSWKNLDSLAGTNNGYGSFEPFHLVKYDLPSDAYHDSLQFRFVSSDNMATTDEYFFDDLKLTRKIGWANLQWPYSISIAPGDTTELIFGQIWIDGVTNQPGQAPDIVAEVGFGPDGSFPYDTLTGAPNPDWTWFPTVYNLDVGNNDEYMGTMVVNEVGVYDYAYRWSYQGGPWEYADKSGINDGYDPADAGELVVIPPQPVLISEIHYNPSSSLQGSDSNFEFVEIANVGIDTADVSGWEFTSGISFTFPANSKIAPGGFAVVARDPDSLIAFYGVDSSIVYGPYSGALSNGGELLVLSDASGYPIDSVDYDDNEPWPKEGDSYGPSIEVVDMFGDNNDPMNWNGSFEFFGSPGGPNQMGPTPLPTTIYQVQHDADSLGASNLLGARVEVPGVVTDDYFVESGITVQDSAAPWNGIHVLTRNHLPIGTQVTVVGNVTEYYGRTALVSTQVFDEGAGVVPDPLLVTPGMIKTGSPTAESYEGVLVELQNVVVSNDNAGYGEWEVTDGVDTARVDNDDYSYTPALGDSLLVLRGVMNYSYDNFKLQPRMDEDIEKWYPAGPQGLTAVSGLDGMVPLSWVPADLLFEGFENGIPSNWQIINGGSDPNGPTWQATTNDAYEGAQSAYVPYGGTSEFQDEWLITDAITISTYNQLHFFHRAAYASWDTDPNYLLVSTTGLPGSFTPVDSFYYPDGTLPDTWTEVTVDLSAYQDSTIYLAWQYQSTWGEDWYIDAIMLSDSRGNTRAITVKPASSPETYAVKPMEREITNPKPVKQLNLPSTLKGGSTTRALLSYNIYRSETPGVTPDPANLIANVPSDSTSYTDVNVTNMHTYYYVVTAVWDEGESLPSNEAEATPYLIETQIANGLVNVVPTIDGVISSGEWDDAATGYATNSGVYGKFYAKNDGNYLYLAWDSFVDTTLDGYDQVGLYFDTDNDGLWAPDSSEGNYWILWDASTGQALVEFRPWLPDTTTGNVVSPAPGVQAAISVASGTVQYEVAIDLATAHFNPQPGDTTGFRFYMYDAGTSSFTGFWPEGAVYNWPGTYGDMIMAQPLVQVIPPSNLVAFQDTSFAKKVYLSWSHPGTRHPLGWARGQDKPVVNTAMPLETFSYYNIYRAGSDTNFVLIASGITDTTYVDSVGLEYDSLYFYAVTAFYDPEGESDPSNVVRVIPISTPPAILFVDDDASMTVPDFEDISFYYTDALDSLNQPYYYYEVPFGADGPPANFLKHFKVVIWTTGETWNGITTLTPNDEDALAQYLDAGGNLFLNSQDYFYDVYPSAGSFTAGQFPYDYLRISSVAQDAWIDPMSTNGAAGSIADGMSFNLATPFGTTSLFVDNLTSYDGTPLFNVDNPSGYAAIQYSGTYNLVFSTIDFAGLVDGTFPNTKVEFMRRVLGFLYAPLALGENGKIPTTFDISQNYPNPFNPTTTIKYQIPKSVDVTLTIYNILGQKVRTLVNKKMEPGYYKVVWDGRNDYGVKVASGIYLYRIKAGDFVQTRKMILMK